MRDSIVTVLVRLQSDRYSVPNGSLGYVEETYPTGATDWNRVDTLTVGWAESPGAGGSSTPIDINDVEFLGQIFVRISDEIRDGIIRRAQLDVPESVIKNKAMEWMQKMIAEMD